MICLRDGQEPAVAGDRITIYRLPVKRHRRACRQRWNTWPLLAVFVTSIALHRRRHYRVGGTQPARFSGLCGVVAEMEGAHVILDLHRLCPSSVPFGGRRHLTAASGALSERVSCRCRSRDHRRALATALIEQVCQPNAVVMNMAAITFSAAGGRQSTRAQWLNRAIYRSINQRYGLISDSGGRSSEARDTAIIFSSWAKAIICARSFS
jgi:hypothetical protein